MPAINTFVSPGGGGYERLPPPRFKPGDFVTTNGTRPGACHRVLECLGTGHDNNRRWYSVEVGTVRVRICESDLAPVEAITELGRIGAVEVARAAYETGLEAGRRLIAGEATVDQLVEELNADRLGELA